MHIIQEKWSEILNMIKIEHDVSDISFSAWLEPLKVHKVEGNVAIVNGVEGLTGAEISAPDLRAGAALVMAGLAAEGYTVIDDIEYIQRGYEDFEGKLRGLGAEIQKVSSEREIQKFKLQIG